MVEHSKKNPSAYAEAGNLLAAALEQLRAINKALAANPSSSQLESAGERARDAVSQIRSAMSSGKLDASSIASLSAALNIGVDASALTVEAALDSRTLAARVELAAASIGSHATVERMSEEMFRKHLFDGDVVRHTHGAGLEAFKRREAADEKYIQEQLARHTGEGDLNASGRMQGYMLDAHAHGAGDNPAFMPKWNELKAKTERLRGSMRAAGLSTDEYDRQITQDVSEFLRSKGMSDAQVKDALAKNKNPLDAVQPFLGSDKASRSLTQNLGYVSESGEAGKRTAITMPDDAQPQTIDFDAIDARLAAVGLNTTLTSNVTGHGLNIQKPRTSVIEH